MGVLEIVCVIENTTNLVFYFIKLIFKGNFFFSILFVDKFRNFEIISFVFLNTYAMLIKDVLHKFGSKPLRLQKQYIWVLSEKHNVPFKVNINLLSAKKKKHA